MSARSLNYMQKTATVAVINRQNKLLILRRGKTAPWMPGRYCLPGGRVEPFEDSQYAAARELSEETGISFPVDRLNNITITYSDNYSKLVYIAKVDSPIVSLNYEHDDYAWISFDESSLYSLVPNLKKTLCSLKNYNYIV